jgi:hypothetical protein
MWRITDNSPNNGTQDNPPPTSPNRGSTSLPAPDTGPHAYYKQEPTTAKTAKSARRAPSTMTNLPTGHASKPTPRADALGLAKAHGEPPCSPRTLPASPPGRSNSSPPGGPYNITPGLIGTLQKASQGSNSVSGPETAPHLRDISPPGSPPAPYPGSSLTPSPAPHPP